jgi:hypothetical protein
MSLWRWLNDAEYADLGFPQPAFRVRDRRFWREQDLIEWGRRRAADPMPRKASPKRRMQHRRARDAEPERGAGASVCRPQC